MTCIIMGIGLWQLPVRWQICLANAFDVTENALHMFHYNTQKQLDRRAAPVSWLALTSLKSQYISLALLLLTAHL